VGLRSLVTLGVALGLTACAEGRRGDAEPAIEASIVDGGRAIEIRGLDRRLVRTIASFPPNDSRAAAAVAVVVESESIPADRAPKVAVPVSDAPPAKGSSKRPPVIGRYEADGATLRFVPRFPFTPGVGYRVDVDQQAFDSTLPPVVFTKQLAILKPMLDRTTRVVSVYPELDTVPENMLRWYVELSAPMATGEALSRVHLIDEAGREVHGAFLQLDEELWDPEHRRVTLLFDPGRVKRGVRTNLESGAPLTAGHRYRLVVDAEWTDGRGAALASGWDRPFIATTADRSSPDPARWSLTVPRGGTREGLAIAFHETLDHALATRMIAVYQAGTRVEGLVTIGPRDASWTFTPNEPWRVGAYELVVDARLEDVAGNSVARVFDADRASGAASAESSAAAGPTRRVSFTVR
jgi:hypothetical protein